MTTSRPSLTTQAEEHRLLLGDLRDVEEMAGPGGTALPAALAERLRGLRARLAEHFRGEEQDGYAQVVLARAPHLDRKVRALLEEHAELARSLETLVRRAETAGSVDEALRQALEEWLGRFRRHEAQENLLLEDAFDFDCCAED